jgi:hypothetical protein
MGHFLVEKGALSTWKRRVSKLIMPRLLVDNDGLARRKNPMIGV